MYLYPLDAIIRLHADMKSYAFSAKHQCEMAKFYKNKHMKNMVTQRQNNWATLSFEMLQGNLIYNAQLMGYCFIFIGHVFWNRPIRRPTHTSLDDWSIKQILWSLLPMSLSKWWIDGLDIGSIFHSANHIFQNGCGAIYECGRKVAIQFGMSE